MLTRCNLKVLTLANHVDRNHDITSVFGAFDFLKRHKFKEGLISKVAMAFFDAANKVYMSSLSSCYMGAVKEAHCGRTVEFLKL